MNEKVAYYVGFFLRVFSGILLLPVVVGLLFGESFVVLEGFIFASFVSIVASFFLMFGKKGKLSPIDGMVTAVICWITAVSIGSIPFMHVLEWGFIDAFFETMSGFTTTGITLVTAVEALPSSLIFWRAIIQWFGGLGILSFFVVVIVEAGGVANTFFNAEADKTDSGKIRPSLFNSVKSLWYVYIVFTLLQTVLLYIGGISIFNSLNYALTTMPTGGFSHTAGGVGGFNSVFIKTVFIFFMFAGGTNFLLLHKLLKGRFKEFFKDFELKLYLKITGFSFLVVFSGVLLSEGGLFDSFITSIFQTVSVISSTGFELRGLMEFPEVSRMILVSLMFVGGSLGSTTGGIKIFRLGVLFKIVAREVKSFSLPKNALNYVEVNGEKIRDSVVFRIVSIVFLWAFMVFFVGLLTVVFSELTIFESMQGVLSSISSMGPLLISQETVIVLPGPVKVLWAITMLAGRLELLPLLVFLNAEILRRK